MKWSSSSTVFLQFFVHQIPQESTLTNCFSCRVEQIAAASQWIGHVSRGGGVIMAQKQVKIHARKNSSRIRNSNTPGLPCAACHSLCVSAKAVISFFLIFQSALFLSLSVSPVHCSSQQQLVTKVMMACLRCDAIAMVGIAVCRCLHCWCMHGATCRVGARSSSSSASTEE